MGDRPFLLVQRYDRSIGEDRVARRLHQEDFCQALGMPPEAKYASEGGPTFKEAFALLRRVAARPAVEVLKLLDAAIFNLIVGNADAHGKNYSLLYRPEGIGFAPLYDLLCTVAYPQVHAKLAMKVGKRATLEEFTPATWTDFAREIGMGAPFVRRRASALAELIVGRIEGVADGIAAARFDGPQLQRLGDDGQGRHGRGVGGIDTGAQHHVGTGGDAKPRVQGRPQGREVGGLDHDAIGPPRGLERRQGRVAKPAGWLEHRQRQHLQP